MVAPSDPAVGSGAEASGQDVSSLPWGCLLQGDSHRHKWHHCTQNRLTRSGRRDLGSPPPGPVLQCGYPGTLSGVRGGGWRGFTGRVGGGWAPLGGREEGAGPPGGALGSPVWNLPPGAPARGHVPVALQAAPLAVATLRFCSPANTVDSLHRLAAPPSCHLPNG